MYITKGHMERTHQDMLAKCERQGDTGEKTQLKLGICFVYVHNTIFTTQSYVYNIVIYVTQDKTETEDALKGKFRYQQKRNEVAWPEIPTDFEDWSPPKKRKTQKK